MLVIDGIQNKITDIFFLICEEFSQVTSSMFSLQLDGKLSGVKWIHLSVNVL